MGTGEAKHWRGPLVVCGAEEAGVCQVEAA